MLPVCLLEASCGILISRRDVTTTTFVCPLGSVGVSTNAPTVGLLHTPRSIMDPFWSPVVARCFQLSVTLTKLVCALCGIDAVNTLGRVV